MPTTGAGSRQPRPGSSARRRRLLAAAACLAVAEAIVSRAGGAPPQTFAEKVLVSEVEVVVELPESVPGASRRALRPADFMVQEDGVLRPVARAEPVGLAAAAESRAGKPGPWDLLVYVDRVLADADMTFLGTVLLAERAAALTRLGRVEVVVADPRPWQVLSATGETGRLEQTLAGLAEEARRQRDREERERREREARQQPSRQDGAPPEGQDRRQTAAGAAAAGAGPRAVPAGERGGGAPPPDEQAVRRQQDRLIDFIAARRPSGPQALLLVAGGFEPRSGPAATAPASTEETARTLAAYGWVAVALPMQRVGLGPKRSGDSDVERLRAMTGGGSAPPNILPSRPRETLLEHEGVINLFVEPRAGSLRVLASLTAGTIVGYEAQLGPALDSLERRWHLFYQAPDAPDGQMHQREVRLAPEGTVLRAPAWRRSSTPESVAAARLRLLLAGDAVRQGARRLAVSAAMRPAAGRTGAGRTPDGELRFAVAAFRVPDGIAPGPFRVSLAFAGDPAVASEPPRHQLLDRTGPSDRGWSQDLPVAVPPGARRLAVCVEDLAHQLWGGTTLELAGGG